MTDGIKFYTSGVGTMILGYERNKLTLNLIWKTVESSVRLENFIWKESQVVFDGNKLASSTTDCSNFLKFTIITFKFSFKSVKQTSHYKRFPTLIYFNQIQLFSTEKFQEDSEMRHKSNKNEPSKTDKAISLQSILGQSSFSSRFFPSPSQCKSIKCHKRK